ncbi:FG-GAP repeat domain-containing protein, partial [Phyllobacterium leguminum]|uniref:FG-GAP repeat domain-containing protein n=1 Tax=Phyllobacterium leguminum TaxID=314237 RepID=UPI0011B61FC2
GKVEGTGPYTLPVTVTGFGTPPAQVRSGLPAGQVPTGDVTILDKTNKNTKLGSAVLAQPAYGIAATSSTLAVGMFPYTMASEDFNKDGRADLAVANGLDNNVQIFLAQTDGKFPATSSSTIPNIPTPNLIVAGDFTNDGYVDLAVGAVGATSNISVFTGKDKGSFDPSPINTVTGGFVAFAVRDFDLNGTLDIAVVNTSNSQVYLGDGKGSFPTKGTQVSVGSNPVASGTSVASAATGDFNNDGKPDLVVPQTPAGKTWVLLGDGQGSFQPDPTPVSTGANSHALSVAVADFDGDGNLDLAIGNNNFNAMGSVALFQGGPTGKTFPSKGGYPIGDENWKTITMAVGDFNADGKPDIATAYYEGPGNVDMQLLLGSGFDTSQWTFTQGATIQPGSYPGVPVTGDFNGDGFTDVAVASADHNDVTIGIVQPTAAVTATVNNVMAVGNPASGKHDVFASYAGDKQFKASDSSANPTPIAPQQLGTGLTLTANPPGTALTGEEVELTAVLTIDGDPQGHVPSGEVQFKVVNEQLGPA